MNMPPQNNPHEILQTAYAHARNIYGRGVTVAVIDTGIFPHRDFYAHGTCRLLAACDFIQHKNEPTDMNGHGTHIAGIIGSAGTVNGHYVGMAPACNLVSVRILDGKGSGTLEHMLEGVYWILEHQKQYHIRIANISIGTASHISSEKDKRLLEAVEMMWDAGIIVVAAAGNQGPLRGSVTAPGTSPKIITVGASDDYMGIIINNKPVKHYSGRGPTSQCVIKPEILAPGFHIVSCKNARSGYVMKSGTSMSTPFVSGAIALLLEKYPDMTGKDVKLALFQSANRRQLTEDKQGWGLLNIPALLHFTSYM